jgi:hypothetical protein
MVCLQEAGANLETHCCAEGCTAELRLPPGLTPFNLANESLTLSGMVQSLRSNGIVKSIVRESILTHDPGGDAPLATRVCCRAPLPTSFSECCSIKCDECKTFSCGVCWEEFISFDGNRCSPGMQELAHVGAHNAIHNHVKVCFGNMGLPPDKDDNSFYPSSDAKRRIVMRGWGKRMLSQYFSKRTAYEARNEPTMQAMVDSLTLEQMMDLVGVLGYPVITMQQVGGT